MNSDSSSDQQASRSGSGCIKTVALIGFGVLLLFLLLPTLDGPGSGEAMRRAKCVNQLKQFGIALQNYHDNHKCFPPAYVADENGKPMHSWRVLILPYMEDEELHKLHAAYRFDEPWDAPHNRSLAAKAPDVFRCPSAVENQSETNYLAIVGDQTVWPGTQRIAIEDVTDRASKTIVLVETMDSGINWLEPRDIPFHQAARGIHPPHVAPSISSRHRHGANTLFCDGSVHFFEDDIPPATLRALLTARAGEEIGEQILD